MRPRQPCCLDPAQRCGTRWPELLAWVGRHVGKGVKLVTVQGDEQGKAPFYAQPVGYDGRAFYIVGDGLCDTEKVMHEACHFLVAPKSRRNMVNYGLGPGPFRPVDDRESDNEEVTVSLVQLEVAPYFALPRHKLQAPDYNVANRRHLDWDACEARAAEVWGRVRPTLESLGLNRAW